MSEVPDETPWTCDTCGARDYVLDGWLLHEGHLYCQNCPKETE
jgi:hypothetical protein